MRKSTLKFAVFEVLNIYSLYFSLQKSDLLNYPTNCLVHNAVYLNKI